MSDYKDTYELYQSVLDEVHAPDELVKRIKDKNNKAKKSNRVKFISAAAACLVAAMIFTLVFGDFNGGGNSFVLKTSAAEIGGESFVEIAKVAPVEGESSSEYDFEGNKKSSVYNCIFPFPLFCDGSNIKSIKYTVDNAVFLFPLNSYASEYREQYPDKAAASDKITEKTESKNKIKSSIENDKQYSSYTVSFNDQIRTEFNNLFDMQTFPIYILARISSGDNISQEAKAAFAHFESDGLLSDESFVNELFKDFGVICDEMLSKITVTAEITYEDGTTDSTSLRFSCLGADQQNGIIFGAKTV